MKILVTGSSGYVGSRLVRTLLEARHTVVHLDIGWFGKNFVNSDVRQIDDLHGADAVIHLAAISNDPSVSFYPRLSWETSVLATMKICELCKETGARLIYASSVSVYGADRGMVTEDMSLNPISDYNKTKMCAERVIMSYPILAQIIRPATICGLSPRMRLDLTVNMLVAQAWKGEMTVHGGTQMRPSIHIEDMCDLYLFMLEHPEHYGVFNAGFENYSILEIADKVRHHTGRPYKILPIKDHRSYQVNSDKLLATGFRPKKTVDDAIDEMWHAWETGELKDDPRWVNLTWMQKLGVADV